LPSTYFFYGFHICQSSYARSRIHSLGHLHDKIKTKTAFPGFFWALLAYSFLTLIACIFSDNPRISFIDSRNLLLFLIVPIVYTGFQKIKDIQIANLALLASGLTSILFSFFIFIFRYEPGERISGFMGHYMTRLDYCFYSQPWPSACFFFLTPL